MRRATAGLLATLLLASVVSAQSVTVGSGASLSLSNFPICDASSRIWSSVSWMATHAKKAVSLALMDAA